MLFNFSNMQPSNSFSRIRTGQGRSMVGEIKSESAKQSGNFLNFRKIAIMAVFIVVMVGGALGQVSSTVTGGDWATGGTWVGGSVPGTGVAVTIVGPVTSVAAITQTAAGSLTINSGGSFTNTGSGSSYTFGALTINTGGIFSTFRPTTILGATNITGAINFASSTGTARAMTFTGTVTLNSGAVWTEPASGNGANNTYAFANNFTNNATTFNALGTGVHTFSGTGMTMSGSTTTSIPSVTITGTRTNNGTLTVKTALAGAGTLTQGTDAILNYNGTSAIVPTLTATASNNTVNYGGSTSTVKATTYVNLTLSGTGVKTFPTGTTTVNGILSIENGTTANTFTGTLAYGASATLQYNAGSSNRTVQGTTAGTGEWPATWANASNGVIIKGPGTITLNAAKSLGGTTPLNINSGGILNTSATAANTLTIGGATTIDGTLTLANTGTSTFTGAVTINNGGFINQTAAGTLSFGSDVTINSGGTLTENTTAVVGIAGSFLNGGTYTASTGTHTFSGTSMTIGGASSILIPNVSVTGTYTNNGTLTVGTALTGAGGLNGTGSLTQGTAGILHLDF